MNKKITGIFVVMLLIGMVFPVVGMMIIDTGVKKGIATTSYGDVLDQYQTDFDPADDLPIPVGRFPIYNFSIQVAQSFKPSKNMLTRVEILVGRNDSTFRPYVLSIRDDLAGEDLVEKIVNPPAFVVGDYSWIEFDFEDIWVDVGHVYYIVCQTENISDNWYLWAANNESESYPFGCAWTSTDGGNTWSNESVSKERNNLEPWDNHIGQNTISYNGITWDTCFKTYGRNNLPPDAPNINGPISGKANNEYDYTFVTVDPDGDDLHYLIDWGDGSVDEWIGPYESDELAIVSHSWSEQGTYIIRARAKDVHDVMGNWATLEVSMPKNQAVSLVEVSIIQPWKGTLYLWGIPLPILPSATIIIGNITVLVSAISLQIMDKLEFYVDGELKYTETNPAVSWQLVTWDWDEKIFFKHTLKVVAYDKGSNTVSDEIDVWIFNM
ncbi:MAG: hypothetical protein KAR64_02240 [Thermoplasmatales archaeon]|nr:hypothetical protein [Thermoplasmatales archaeon]